MLYKKLFGKYEKRNYQERFEQKKGFAQRKRFLLCAVYLSWMLLFPELLEEWKLCTVSVLEQGEWVECSMEQIADDALVEVDYKLGLAAWLNAGEKLIAPGVIEAK